MALTNRAQDKQQFYADMATVDELCKHIKKDCEGCGHPSLSHWSDTELYMPARCFRADCVCTAPAHTVREKKIQAALTRIFGDAAKNYKV